MEQNLTAEQTNPPTTRARKRLRHHLWLAVGTIALTALIYGVLMLVYPSPRLWIFRWSLATAYLASALLAFTLTLGAWNLRRGKTNVYFQRFAARFRDLVRYLGDCSYVHRAECSPKRLAALFF